MADLIDTGGKEAKGQFGEGDGESLMDVPYHQK